MRKAILTQIKEVFSWRVRFPVNTVAMFRLVILSIAVLMATACQSTTEPATTVVRPIYQEDAPTSSTVGDINLYRMTNGMQIIHRERTTNEIVGIVLHIDWGGIVVPEDKAGLAMLISSAMIKGTKNRDAEEIADVLGSLGSSLSISPGYDSIVLSMRCVVDDLDKALEILADVALHATFPEEQVALEKDRILAHLRMVEDRPASLSLRIFQEKLFGNHPYGRPLDGTLETIPNLKRSDLLNAHHENFVPSNMVISAVGNVSRDRFVTLATKHFGEPGPAKEKYLEADQVIYPGGSRTPVLRSVEQGHIVIGHVICEVGHEDHAALRVASAVLGEGMSARLFRELRDKQGLAYSIGSQTSFRKHKGAFYTFIGTAKENLEKAEEALWQQIKNLRDQPVSDQELQRAKNYISGQYLRGHETNLQQARYLGAWYTAGLGVEYDETFLEKIEAVTSRDVMFVANKYFLDPTTVVIEPTAAAALAQENPAIGD